MEKIIISAKKKLVKISESRHKDLKKEAIDRGITLEELIEERLSK